MSSILPSVRYCALMDGPCSEKFETARDLSALIAYPSEDTISHDMREASEKAQQRGMPVTTWEDLARQDRIVFCKICKGIMATRSLWAEVTHPNQNVFLEIGYALARGRELRLFRDPTVRSQRVELLSTIEHIEYQNVDELLNKISKPADSSLANQCREHAQTHPDDLHALFCRTQFRTTAAERIYRQLERRLRPLGIRLRVDDRDELRGHNFVELASLAQRARLVVVNLAGSNREDSHLHNAAASLIAGYAMGCERRVLVLQETPADHMLDLQQVRKEYRDAKDAVGQLEAWLEGTLEYLEERAHEVREERRTRQASLQRWALDLGAVAAEYDRLLTECFVENHAYNAALHGHRELFVGRRGSGKTANCLLVEQRLQDRPGVVVSRIEPDELQLRRMVEDVEHSLERNVDAAVFQTMWRFVLCTEMAAALLRHFDDQPHLYDPLVAGALSDALGRIACDPQETFDSRLLRAMRELQEVAPAGSNARQAMLQKFHGRDIAELLKVLRSLSGTHQVVLLIDNLDKDWTREHQGMAVGLINGLLNEAQRLAYRDLQDIARIVVFLRSDIYEIVSGRDPDRDKKSPILLEWSREQLFEMVTRRIRVALRDAEQRPPSDTMELWHTIFVESGPDGTPSFDYLVNRTMLRPRDVLQFCIRCLDGARQSGHERVTVEDIAAAERSYSVDLFNHLRQEFAVGYPDLIALRNVLFDKPRRMPHRRWLDVLARATTDPSLVSYTIDHLRQFCYEAGITGIEVSGETHYGFAGTSYATVEGRVRASEESGKQAWVVIHQGLHKHLGLE